MSREHYTYSGSGGCAGYVGMDGYEEAPDGTVLSMPFCPHGCRRFHGKGNPAPRIRLERKWIESHQHWSLKCWKCKREAAWWA